MRLRLLAVVLALPVVLAADDRERILTIDHFVRVRSTVPAMNGQDAQIYVRERVQAGRALGNGSWSGRVALFVHGAGTPSEVAFDVPYGETGRRRSSSLAGRSHSP